MLRAVQTKASSKFNIRLTAAGAVAVIAATLTGCSGKSSVQSAGDPAKITVVGTVAGESGTVPESIAEDGTPTDDTVAADAVPETTAPDTAAPNSISEQPGQAKDNYVGALKDVKMTSCKLDGASWTADGTVTNPTDADATYRIYVALNVKGSTDTKALIEADVDVAKGKTEKWAAAADVADKDLMCILRVERAKK
jgi:hypothetical protein